MRGVDIDVSGFKFGGRTLDAQSSEERYELGDEGERKHDEGEDVVITVDGTSWMGVDRTFVRRQGFIIYRTPPHFHLSSELYIQRT